MTGASEGVRRAVDALLRVGGTRVWLRVPAPAAAGDDTEQLGLATPGFADTDLGRGALRRVNSTGTLLVAASAVPKALRASGVASSEALFAGAMGIVIAGVLYRIESSAPMSAGDGVFGYSLTLLASTT